MINTIVELNQQEILAISGGLEWDNSYNEYIWNGVELAIIITGCLAIYWAAPPLANVIVAKFAKDAVAKAAAIATIAAVEQVQHIKSS